VGGWRRITKSWANHDDLARDLIFGAARQVFWSLSRISAFNLLGQINGSTGLEPRTLGGFMLAGRATSTFVL